MLFRLLLYFGICLWSLPLIAQTDLERDIEIAKAELAKTKDLYSKKHLSYADQALYLASLYYASDSINHEGEGDAEVLAVEGIEVYRDSFDRSHSRYLAALRILPAKRARFHHLSFNVKDSEEKGGLLYVQDLLALSRFYVKEEDYEAHSILIQVFRLFQDLSLPPQEQRSLLQELPKALIEVVEWQLRLEQLCQKPNLRSYVLVDSVKISNDSIAEALLQFAKTVQTAYNYKNQAGTRVFDLMDIPYHAIYEGIRKVLNYYEQQNQIKDYQLAYRILSKDMQEFYELEKRFNKQLEYYQIADPKFQTNFSRMLVQLDGDVGVYVNYVATDIFDQVLTRIQKREGKNSANYRYYYRMQKNQGLSENEIFIKEERDSLALLELELLHFSEDFIQRMIQLAKIEYEEGEEQSALKHFERAIDIARSMDQGKIAEDEFDLNLEDDLDLDLDVDLDLDLDFEEDSLATPKKGPLEKKYWAMIPPVWQQILAFEEQLALEKTGLNYMRAGNYYLQEDILTTKGWKYFKTGLDALDVKDHAEGLELLFALLQRNPTFNLDEFKEPMIASFSLEELLPVIDAILLQIEEYYNGRDHRYAEALAIKADVYYASGLDTDRPNYQFIALEIYHQALDLYVRTEGEQYGYYLLLEELTKKVLKKKEKGQLPNLWPVEEVMEFFDKRLEIAKLTDLDYGELSWNYFNAIQDYASWHYQEDRYVSAESLYKDFLSVLRLKNKDTWKKYRYPEILHNLARIYRKTGRQNLSFEFYQKAVAIALDFKSYKIVIESLDGQALLLQDIGEYDLALELFEQCLSYWESIEIRKYLKRDQAFDDALLYIKNLRHLGRLYFAMGDYDQAMDYYQQVMDFESTSSLVSFKYDNSLKRDLGLWYDHAFEDKKALKYYNQALNGFTDPEDIADCELRLANFYERRGRDSLAAPHYLKALEIDLEQLRTNYKYLAEEERLLFLNTLMPRIEQFYAFVGRAQDSLLIAKMLNAHLIIKGLALENTTNIRSVIYASEHVALKDLYKEMQLLRKQIADAAVLTAEEKKAKGIDIAELNNLIKQKEDALSEGSQKLVEIFKRQNRQVNFEKLQEILEEDAAAIDFIVIKESDDLGRKIPYYYAFLIRPNAPYPQLIKLCMAEDLNLALETKVQPNTINYVTDAAESYYLYTLVWEMLDPYLKEVKQIHICPTGAMAKIAFATLRVDEYSQQRLMDQHQIYYHTALRDLITEPVPEGASVNARPKIMLVGGVEFSMNTEDLQQALDPRLWSRLDSSKLANFGKFDPLRPSGGEDFTYLPGTLSEVDTISELFKDFGWQVETFKGEMALEGAVGAAMEDSVIVLHIATHGFFFSKASEALDLSAKMDKANERIEARLARESNPLLRSGLAMAGVNHVWKGGQSITGLQDGIFTAYEVANLDLFNTELVVLSACETGQGDINNNEGVIGLQRAFKMAGAKRLIISLWKVPDAQTSELMKLFYKNYLQKNMDIHQAFEQAQHEMRQRYPNAYYWAAFILVE